MVMVQKLCYACCLYLTIFIYMYVKKKCPTRKKGCGRTKIILVSKVAHKSLLNMFDLWTGLHKKGDQRLELVKCLHHCDLLIPDQQVSIRPQTWRSGVWPHPLQLSHLMACHCHCLPQFDSSVSLHHTGQTGAGPRGKQRGYNLSISDLHALMRHNTDCCFARTQEHRSCSSRPEHWGIVCL